MLSSFFDFNKNRTLKISAIGAVVLLVLIEWSRNMEASGVQIGIAPDARTPFVETDVPLLPRLSEQPGVYRFGTFNIHGGRSDDGQPVLTRLVSLTRSVDVIGLQEVHGGGWDGMENQAMTMARHAGARHWLTATTRLRWFRPHGGNALISRSAILRPNVSPLPGGRNDFRNQISLELDLDGETVTVINTHLSRRSLKRRLKQFAIVTQAFLSHDKAILMGDFNMPLADPKMQAFLAEEGVIDALGNIAERDNVKNLKIPEDVDWIFVRGLTVLNAGRIPRGISDHPMIWADVSVNSGL